MNHPAALSAKEFETHVTQARESILESDGRVNLGVHISSESEEGSRLHRAKLAVSLSLFPKNLENLGEEKRNLVPCFFEHFFDAGNRDANGPAGHELRGGEGSPVDIAGNRPGTHLQVCCGLPHGEPVTV